MTKEEHVARLHGITPRAQIIGANGVVAKMVGHELVGLSDIVRGADSKIARHRNLFSNIQANSMNNNYFINLIIAALRHNDRKIALETIKEAIGNNGMSQDYNILSSHTQNQALNFLKSKMPIRLKWNV